MTSPYLRFADAERRTGQRRAWAYPILKRATDLFLASLILLLTGPLMLLAATVVAVVSRGTPLIKVERVGLGGRPIHIHKLRTMQKDGERLLQKYLDANPGLADEWFGKFKLKNDPRVIPYVGTFLRKSSIDELPQLLDVLVGRISLVGPRPFPEYHMRAFDASFRELRVSVPPGLTGLWQIECRNSGDLQDQVYWDTRYVERRSYMLDLAIIARTPIAVLVGRSAY